MERKIGEKFKYQDKWYEVVDGDKCNKCDLKHDCGCRLGLYEILGDCAKSVRIINKDSIVFKEIPKPHEFRFKDDYVYIKKLNQSGKIIKRVRGFDGNEDQYFISIPPYMEEQWFRESNLEALECVAHEQKNEEPFELEFEEGKKYYFVTAGGYVTYGCWFNSRYDNHRKSIGNTYITSEQAERALSKKQDKFTKIMNMVENYVIRVNKDWKADWSNSAQGKWCLSYKYSFNEWVVDFDFCTRNSRIYMSKELAEKIVKILNSDDKYKL